MSPVAHVQNGASTQCSLGEAVLTLHAVCFLNNVDNVQVLQSTSEAMTAKQLAQAAITNGLISSSTKVAVLSPLNSEV